MFHAFTGERQAKQQETYCLATMILLTTMDLLLTTIGSCEASSLAHYVQPPKSFRHVYLRTSVHPIQALHNQPHFSATAVGLLLRNPIDFDITHIPDNRHQEQDESNPASSCRTDQRECQSALETCDGMDPVIIQLPYNDMILLDRQYIAYMEETVTKSRNI